MTRKLRRYEKQTFRSLLKDWLAWRDEQGRCGCAECLKDDILGLVSGNRL